MNRNKKGQAAPQAARLSKSQTQKKRSQRGGAGAALSRPGIQLSRTVPARLVTRRRAYASVVGGPKETVYGDHVVTVHGSQQMVTVSNTAAASPILAGAERLIVSPDTLGGTLAGLANRYNKYFFTRLLFEYVPYQPNSTDGHGFAFAFNNEPTSEFSVTFPSISTLEHSMVLPMTGYIGGPDMNILEVRPSRKSNPWYWCEDDAATLAGQRQTQQGALYGLSDSAITNATTWGTIWLHYELELCDITPDQGFTLKQLRKFASDSDPEVAALIGKAVALLSIDSSHSSSSAAASGWFGSSSQTPASSQKRA